MRTPSRAVLPWSGSEKVFISAHRGGREHHPESSLAAYTDAIERGCDMVEFDVRRSGDGELVVVHDTHSDGREVGATPSRELRAGGRPVASLREVLECIHGRALAHVDLKETGSESQVVEMCEEVLGPGQSVYTTLEDVSVRTIRTQHPDVVVLLSIGRSKVGMGPVPTAWARARERRPMRRVLAADAHGVAIHHRLLTPALSAWLAERELATLVWTVDEDADLTHWLGRRDVQVVTTNRPARALALRDETRSPETSGGWETPSKG